MTARRRAAWVLAAVDMLVLFVAIVFAPTRDYRTIASYVLGIGGYVGIGAFLVSRVPTNPIGALLLLTGTLGVAAAATGAYAELGAVQVPPWPGTDLAHTAGDAMFIYPSLVALVGIPLVFPDGHLPSRQFRWVVVLTIAAMVGWFLGSIFDIDVGIVVLVSVPVAFGGAVAAVVLRFRHGGPVQRQQVKWLAADVGVGATAVLAGLLVNGLNQDLGAVLIIVGIAALFVLPFVIGMAILRYRLYEIDRIVSRTLAYLLMTAVLVGSYAALVVILGGPLADFTGGDTISVAISTLLVAALFQPVRGRVQALVDRRFDRARYDGQRLVGAFADRLRWETDMDRVTADLRSTVAGAVAPADLAVWLRTGRPSR